MAYYAVLDSKNVVVQVIAGDDGDVVDGGFATWEEYYSDLLGQKCLLTSYETMNGQHINGGEPFRGNAAGIGMSYNPTLDAFVPPKPYKSWVLNKETYSWDAPVPMPEDSKYYKWDESVKNWVEVIPE